jgi:hypothetical protein
VLAASTARRRHVGLHQLLHHLQAGTDRESKKPLAQIGGNLGHRHPHLLRHSQRTRVELVDLILLGHSGPLSLGVLGGSPETYHPVGLRRETQARGLGKRAPVWQL